MNPTVNLEKRIRRHVIAKKQSFFAATPPGFETLCRDELVRIGISPADAVITRGGIEFNARLHTAYMANLELRTANRILMRLASFTASNFRQLEKKLSGIPWELYLNKDATYTLHITSKQSRLIHTDAIAERVTKSMAGKPGMQTDAAARPDDRSNDRSGPVQQIFVRVQNDRFTISIDSSGELLHKRGLKTQGGSAPIRETMAAAILMIAGYTPGKTLIDPMCGSGTFSLEAAMMACNIPAGWYRKFAFTDWPSFQPLRWQHIRREAEKNMITRDKPLLFASDNDPATAQKLAEIVTSHHLSDTIRVQAADFFTLVPHDIKDLPDNPRQPGLIVLNPPYGRRLGSKGAVEKMFDRICEKLKSDFKGWKVALLVPDKHLLTNIPFKATAHDFIHGGLSITLVTFKIR